MRALLANACWYPAGERAKADGQPDELNVISMKSIAQTNPT
jgi:hypothetical protein